MRKCFIYVITFMCILLAGFNKQIVTVHANDLTDVMHNWEDYNEPEEEAFEEGGLFDTIIVLIEYAVSIGIYVIFTLMFAQTAVDFIYIVIPPIRGYMIKTPNENMGSSEEIKEDNKEKCLVSQELKLLVLNNTKQGDLLSLYLKKRSVTIALLTIIVILLITSNIFFKTGFNIGEAIYKAIKGAF